MSVLIIEGPEKAGKSTLAEAIKRHIVSLGGKVIIRHQVGRAIPDEGVYFNQLLEDCAKSVSELVAIWDRGWPSEYVYGTLLHQPRRMVKDPWKGEWVLGRLVQANGLRVLLTADPEVLASRRDGSDLPVDPSEEQRLYIEYARKFGWSIYRAESSWSTPMGLAAMLTSEFFRMVPAANTPCPPLYHGKSDAETIIVTTNNQFIIGRKMGDTAFKVGWVVSHMCPPQTLRHAKTLVVCDAKAELWVNNYVIQRGGGQKVISAVGQERPNLKQLIHKLEKE